MEVEEVSNVTLYPLLVFSAMCYYTHARRCHDSGHGTRQDPADAGFWVLWDQQDIFVGWDLGPSVG